MVLPDEDLSPAPSGGSNARIGRPHVVDDAVLADRTAEQSRIVRLRQFQLGGRLGRNEDGYLPVEVVGSGDAAEPSCVDRIEGKLPDPLWAMFT